MATKANMHLFEFDQPDKCVSQLGDFNRPCNAH